MNKIIIIILCLSVTYLHGQNKGIITLPIGEGGGDSLGNVIPDTELLIGQGTNLATSTDSLVWLNPVLEVTGDVTVVDEAYGAGWNGIFEVPTKNAIYDIINTLPTGPAGSAEEVQFRNSGAFGANTLFQWDNSDHVLGIGIAAPTAPDYFIHLHHPVTNSATGIYYTNATSGTTLLSDGFFTGYSDKAFFVNYENTPIEWYTNALLRMEIRGGGNIGIGTAGTVSSQLHVISDDPTNESSIIAQNDNSSTAFTSTFAAMSLRNNNTTANNYVRFNFQDASSTAAAAIASQITDHTNDYGTLEFWTRSSAGFSQKMVIVEGGNVGIGTTPNTYGKLDISSTTGALIVPRMTTTQRDAMTAVAGMIIYNTTTATFQGYTSAWNNL